MSYRFRSKATGDLLMLSPTGDELLAAMGIDPAPQGILLPERMAAAMLAIEAAIARAEAAPAEPGPDDDDTVSLRQRAWPLLEMLQRCHASGEPIVWGT